MAILHLNGFLGDDAVTRFSGAVDWSASRVGGPLIFNAGTLMGGSELGRFALWAAAGRLAASGRAVAICAHSRMIPSEQPADGPEIGVYPDLTAALAAITHEHRPVPNR